MTDWAIIAIIIISSIAGVIIIVLSLFLAIPKLRNVFKNKSRGTRISEEERNTINDNLPGSTEISIK